jgi:hypothetical protein
MNKSLKYPQCASDPWTLSRFPKFHHSNEGHTGYFIGVRLHVGEITILGIIPAAERFRTCWICLPLQLLDELKFGCWTSVDGEVQNTLIGTLGL